MISGITGAEQLRDDEDSSELLINVENLAGTTTEKKLKKGMANL